MAIGILLVLTITVTSVITYTGAGARGASLDESGQRSYALAEAGINNALSVLADRRQRPDGNRRAAVGRQRRGLLDDRRLRERRHGDLGGDVVPAPRTGRSSRSAARRIRPARRHRR